MHMRVGSCVPWFMYGNQRTILGAQFSLSTILDLGLNAVCQAWQQAPLPTENLTVQEFYYSK